MFPFLRLRNRKGGEGHICHSVILEFRNTVVNLNLANNFWTVGSITLIFHMNISSEKTFPLVPTFLPCVHGLDLSLENFNLAIGNNVWTASSRSLQFHLSIASDIAFLWVSIFLTLWHFPQNLAYVGSCKYA